MTEHSRWRRALAERYAAGYPHLPGVRAVVLAGSVARGIADRYSDIELMVFWDGPPEEPLRRRAAEAGGGTVAACHGYDPDNDEWADDVLVSGVEVQVSHRTVAGTERWLADVLDRADPDLVKQDLIALIEHGVALSGAELVQAWQRRVAHYPAPLALAMVRAHLDFGSAWQRRKLADRGELLPLYDDLTATVRNVLLVLLGLNRVYFPHLGFKWMHRLATRLPVAPADLASRLDAVLTAPPETAVPVADALITETLTLVAAHLPDAGAAEELALFRQERPVWDTAPP
jgi:hypothetical protein